MGATADLVRCTGSDGRVGPNSQNDAVKGLASSSSSAQAAALAKAIGRMDLSELTISLRDLAGYKEQDLEEFKPHDLELIERQLTEKIGVPGLEVVYLGLEGFKAISTDLADCIRQERAADYKSHNSRLAAVAGRNPEPHLDSCAIMAGPGSRDYAELISHTLGLRLTGATHSWFANSEQLTKIPDSVRGMNVFFVHRIGRPINEHLAALRNSIEALHEASAESVTVVLPYYPYSRQDRKGKDGRVGITAAVVARCLQDCNVKRVLTFDIHSPQTAGAFNPSRTKFDNFSGLSLLLPRAHELLGDQRVCPIFPDSGSHKRADEDGLIQKLPLIFPNGIPPLVADKSRGGPNSISKMRLIGEADDIAGLPCVIFDDMIDTAGTGFTSSMMLKRAQVEMNMLQKALDSGAQAKKQGASYVMWCASHAVFSRWAARKILENTVEVDGREVPVVDKVLVLDTIPFLGPRRDRIEVVSTVPLLAEAISRICRGRGSSLRQLIDVYSGLPPNS